MTLARTSALLLIQALGLSAQAIGQEFIDIVPDGGLFRIDPRTGLTVPSGGTGLRTYFWTSLAQDSGGQVYSSYGRFDHPYEIHRIDPATGQSTFNLQTTLVGVSGMAFGPNDELYLTNDPSAPLGRDYDLAGC